MARASGGARPAKRAAVEESVDEALRGYLARYAAGTGSTARAKRYDIETFRIFLGERATNPIASITPETIKEFIDTRLAAGDAQSTVRRRAFTLSHFFKRVAERNGIENPTLGVQKPKKHYGAPRALDNESKEKLRRNVALQPRDRAIVEIMLQAGLGRGEVVSLIYGQLDRRAVVGGESQWFLRNIRRKGVGFRDLPLMPGARAALGAYLPERAAALKKTAPTLDPEDAAYPLFVSTRRARAGVPSSFRVSDVTVYKMIKRAAKECGIADMTPHRLRHTFARNLFDETKDIRLVSQALGHSDLNQTMRYTLLDEAGMIDGMKKLK